MEKIENFCLNILEKMKLKKLANLYRNHLEVMRYLIFGALTTVINIVAYWICFNKLGIPNLISNIIAWFLSVAVAYITNRGYVFHSEASNFKAICVEILLFFASRLLTLGIDEGIMFISVDKWHWNALLMKIISNVIVIILNFVFSKILIFRKKK